MTKWMRTAGLKKLVVGLVMVASVPMGAQGAVAATAGDVRMGRVPIRDARIERFHVGPGTIEVTLHGGFNLTLTIHKSSGELLAEKTCFEVCKLEFQISTWSEIRVRIGNPEPEEQAYMMFVNTRSVEESGSDVPASDLLR